MKLSVKEEPVYIMAGSSHECVFLNLIVFQSSGYIINVYQYIIFSWSFLKTAIMQSDEAGRVRIYHYIYIDIFLLSIIHVLILEVTTIQSVPTKRVYTIIIIIIKYKRTML